MTVLPKCGIHPLLGTMDTDPEPQLLRHLRIASTWWRNNSQAGVGAKGVAM